MISLDLGPKPYGVEQAKLVQSWADVWAINLSKASMDDSNS